MRFPVQTRLRPWLLVVALMLGGCWLGGCQTDSENTAGRSVAEPAPDHYRDFQDADALSAYLRSAPDPLVGAHRGGPGEGFPENATPTFGRALTHGPVLLECDVRMTRDSVLVLMHDPTLGRTTTGTGPVQNRTLEEMRALQLVTEAGTPTRFEVPTLPEALTWAEGRAVLQLDVKDDVPRPRVISTLRRHDGLDQALVITYTLDDARWYHRRLPNLILSASAETREEAKALIQDVDPSRLLGWVGVGEIPDGPAEVFSAHGVPVAVGTFGDVDRQARRQGLSVFHRLFDEGADLVASDETALASQAARTYRSGTTD
ncbi:MAG: glycerophosphodiester phosphodiesterase family protein [Salinibacter sp.]